MPGSHTHLKESLVSPDPNIDPQDLVTQDEDLFLFPGPLLLCLTTYLTFELSKENVYSQYRGVGEGLRIELIKQGGRRPEDGVNKVGRERA